MTKKFWYIIIEVVILFFAILFMALSKIEPILLFVGLFLMIIFFALASVYTIYQFVLTNRSIKAMKAKLYLESTNTQFSDVQITYDEKNITMTNYFR